MSGRSQNRSEKESRVQKVDSKKSRKDSKDSKSSKHHQEKATVKTNEKEEQKHKSKDVKKLFLELFGESDDEDKAVNKPVKDVKKVEDKKPRKDSGKNSKIVKHQEEKPAVKIIEKKEQKQINNEPKEVRIKKLCLELFGESDDEEIVVTKNKEISSQSVKERDIKKIEDNKPRKESSKDSKIIKPQQEAPAVKIIEKKEQKQIINEPKDIRVKKLCLELFGESDDEQIVVNKPKQISIEKNTKKVEDKKPKNESIKDSKIIKIQQEIPAVNIIELEQKPKEISNQSVNETNIKKVEDYKPRIECSNDSIIIKPAVKIIENKEQKQEVKALNKQVVMRFMKNKPRRFQGKKLTFEESDDDEIALNKQKENISKSANEKQIMDVEENKSVNVFKHQQEESSVITIEKKEQKQINIVPKAIQHKNLFLDLFGESEDEETVAKRQKKISSQSVKESKVETEQTMIEKCETINKIERARMHHQQIIRKAEYARDTLVKKAENIDKETENITETLNQKLQRLKEAFSAPAVKQRKTTKDKDVKDTQTEINSDRKIGNSNKIKRCEASIEETQNIRKKQKISSKQHK